MGAGMRAGAVVLGTLVLGFVRLLVRHRELEKKSAFASEYLDTFMRFAVADENDASAYAWLVRKSVRLQEEMGDHGISAYSPPGSFRYIPNYQVIVNMLPEIMYYRQERFGLGGSTYSNIVRLYWETLTRYTGVLDEQSAQSLKRLGNPFVWLQMGVQTVLVVPLLILSWVGLIGRAAVAKAENHAAVNILSGVIALVQFVSALAGLVIGWEEFTTLIVELLQKLL